MQSFTGLFISFLVPTEISSDGGPKFTAKDLFQSWVIRHRMSSVSFPSSKLELEKQMPPDEQCRPEWRSEQ